MAVPRDDHGSRPALTLVTLACILLLVLAGCGGDGDSARTSGEGDVAATDTTDDSASGDEGGNSGEGPEEAADDGGEASGDLGGGDDGAAEEARFNLIASPDNAECSYVPNGDLSGADLLSVYFYFLIIGGNPPDVPALRVTGASDTGLSTSYTSGPHNQAVSAAQFALRSDDFGRSHTLTITVDAADEVPETDESDNRISVSVSLPSPRPSETMDPLPCSVTRG